MDLLPIIQSLPPELQQALAKDGFEAVKALASCVYKSCGQLLLPWQMVRVAQAESKAELIKSEAKAKSIRMIGQAISEYSELGIKFNGNLEELNINNTDLKALETRANIRINQQQLRKQKNLENVVGKAYNELIGKKLDSNVEIDEDWLTRFFETVEEKRWHNGTILKNPFIQSRNPAKKIGSLRDILCAESTDCPVANHDGYNSVLILDFFYHYCIENLEIFNGLTPEIMKEL